MEADATTHASVLIDGLTTIAATTMNEETGIMTSREPVIADVTVTPSAIMSETTVKVKEGPYDVAIEEQQPPLKKIKLEYESEKEEEDDQFADAIDTTTAAVNSAVQEDTYQNSDSTTLDSSNANLVEEVIPSQPQPPLPLVVESTPMVTPSDPPMAVSADTTKQDNRVGVEENDLFGTVEDNKTNENIVQTADVLVASAAPMVIPQSGDVSLLPSVDHPAIELLSEQPVVPTTSGTSTSEPVSTVGGDSISTPGKALSTTEFAIPRKSSQTKATTAARVAMSVHHKQNFTSGTRYGLPAGVNVPGSIVQSKLLEVEMNTPGSKLMDVLKSLPVNLINDALTEYDDAVEIKGANSIRNHGAYLYGVVKRYVSVLERSMNGDTVSGQNPMGEDGLTSAVQMRLDLLVTSGFCTQQEMTDKVKSKIRMLSEKDAMCALDDLSSVDRSQIRNFGSYLMGILNRYMRGEPSSKKSSSSSSSSSSMYPGSGGHNTNTPPNRHSRDHREPTNNRFAPSLHNNNNNTSFTSSSFSSSYPPNSRKNNTDSRLDQRGNHHGGSSQRPPFRMDQNNNNNLQSFDGHRQQQPQQQQGTHLVPSWQQNQPTPPNQYMGGQGNMPNHMVPNPTNPNISGIPPTNFNYHGQQQQFPPPQQMQSSSYMPQPPVPQQSFGQPSPYSIANNMQPQTGLQPSTAGMYQPQPNGMMMGQQSHQQPFLANPSSQQQQPPTLMNQSSSQFVPNHMSQVPQSSIDIMGLADKAASAIQALGANNKLMGQPVYNPPQQMQSQQQQGYHHQQQQQLSYNAGLGQPQSSSVMMPQPSRPGQPMFGQNQIYPPQQQQPPAFGGSNMANPLLPQQQQGARRRTTASFHELPMSVQYALQNLIASGAIDGQPDDGILGMIMDLPEQMALVGLQKFAAVDKSTMRNRFAYLAGVLRRELAAINRR